MNNTNANSEKRKYFFNTDSYFRKLIKMGKSENESPLKIAMPGFFGLSPVGKQILKHLNPKYNDNYFVWLKEKGLD